MTGRARCCGWTAWALRLSVAAASSLLAADKPQSRALTSRGETLQARYEAMLSSLREEIVQALPKVSEEKQAALEKASEEVRKAAAELQAAQQPLDKIQSAQALVEHAKGKWIGGARKGIAAAEEALRQAKTDAEREAAQTELAKWQANLEEGLKALTERQAALDAARVDEAKYRQAYQEAQAALAQVQSNELNAARAMLTDLTSFLSSDQMDEKLVKAIVLKEATPRGLAEFAELGTEQESLVEKLLKDLPVLKEMVVAGGAKGGQYGRAMEIYTAIQKVSPRASGGLFRRLALAVSLEHAVPIPQKNAAAATAAPAVVDPVKRYQHYEKAYLEGELDPAFSHLSTWDYRMVVDSDAPDEILAWGRDMLRNYRPDHLLNPDYGWRYSGIVRTDVAYRHSQEYQDRDDLQFYQNIIKNGGVCGRRAWFGGFILRSFGIPIVRRPQPGHAALARWTPKGWVVNLGAGWGSGSVGGRPDKEFLLETQVRRYPQDYLKVLRAEWISRVLEESSDKQRPGATRRVWARIAHYQRLVLASQAVTLGALGEELGEAEESAETRAQAVTKATVTEADRQVTVDSHGAITVPVAACTGRLSEMKSFLGGLQAFCSGPFSCNVDVPKGGVYRMTARVVSVHDEGQLPLTVKPSEALVTVRIPYTCGKWEQTDPVELTLTAGQNELCFGNPSRGFTLKDLTLVPVR